MNEPSSRDLLGYMLGALETADHQQIEDQIELDPELKEELQEIRGQIALLEELDPPGLPTTGLARRTCEAIASTPANWFDAGIDSTGIAEVSRVAEKSIHDSAIHDSVNGSSHKPSPNSRLSDDAKRTWFRESSSERGANGRNSIMNFVMVAVIIMLLAAIALPVLNNSRINSRLLACQNNLRIVGKGLLDYADNSGGKYVSIPVNGNLGFAGVYASKLLDGSYVDSPDSFMCAGVGNATGRKIPSIPSVDELISADKYAMAEFRKTGGGDFAYIMGQLKDGEYQAGTNQNRPNFILLADNPGSKVNGRQSDNHGGYGQNVFFEDGRVAFLEVPEINGDAIYENDFGGIGPATHANDIVLVPGRTTLSGLNID